MSIARLALRLAVVETLAPSAQYAAGASAVWPTLAQGRIGDSDNPPDDVIAPRQVAMRVYTDETERAADGPGVDVLANPFSPQKAMLAVEILVPGMVTIDTTPTLSLAVETDALAEALLDLAEAQVLSRLTFALTQAPLYKVVTRFAAWKSQPWRDADTNTRMSARRLEFDVETYGDGPWPVFNPAETGETALLNRLAEPLRSVAIALPSGSYGRQACLTLAAHLAQPGSFTALETIRMAANLTRAADDDAPDDPDASATPPSGDIGGSVSL